MRTALTGGVYERAGTLLLVWGGMLFVFWLVLAFAKNVIVDIIDSVASITPVAGGRGKKVLIMGISNIREEAQLQVMLSCAQKLQPG